ncbi:MAG: DUF1565 domain-containing protein [Armatimonadota bacterium]
MARLWAVAALIIILAFFSSTLWASDLTTDFVREALTLDDGSSASLPSVFVSDIIFPYAVVTDLYGPGPHPSLAVFLGKFQVGRYNTLNIRGTITTLGQDRVLIAHEIEVFTNSEGFPFEHPFPCRALPWDYIVDAQQTQTPATDTSALPAIPIPEPKIIEPLSAPIGTIAATKIINNSTFAPTSVQSLASVSTLSSTPQLETGQVEITDRPVTAVYRDTSGNVIFFYIQENIVGGNGIKCVPIMTIPVEPGNIVTVKGGVEVVSGEAQITAQSVKCTGSTARPRPIGLNNRATAAGEFGIQPALYLKTSDASPSSGLSCVGTRVRVFGAVLETITEGGHTSIWIDDGSGLSTTAHNGLKIIYWNPSDAPTSQTYISVTGVLGAEMADNKAIPVVRVPESTPWETPTGVKYVKQNGTGNGTSWADAYGSVQSAIEAARPSGEVWVAAGQYGTISLKESVRLYGGFAGTETLREQRNWVANASILDGHGTSRVVLAESGVTEYARIDGFTIRNGLANNSSGGGILCDSVSPIIANNIITANVAGYGGGISIGTIYGSDGRSPIWNNVISGNSAGYYGGGVYSYALHGQIICNNTIVGNTTTYYAGEGGGVWIQDQEGITTIPYTTIANNVFEGNTSGSYGGGLCWANGIPVVQGNKFINNTVTQSTSMGGAVHIDSVDSPFLIDANTFEGNSAASGGAISKYYCRQNTISNNLFIRNHARGNTTNNLGGGAILCWQDYYAVYTTTVVNNTFVENWVGTGTWPNITPLLYGGAIHVNNRYTGLQSINNIFYGNRARDGSSVACTNRGNASVSYCDAYPNLQSENYFAFSDGSQMTIGSGLIYADPVFCGGSAESQYWLAVGSPCRGSGQNPSQNSLVPMQDKVGNPRPGTDSYTDMGTYENDGYSCP